MCHGVKLDFLAVGSEWFAVVRYEIQLDAAAADQLTPAERSVLHLLFERLSNQEIAALRHTSVRTVANQVASIFAKLHVGSRAELLAPHGSSR